MLNSIFLIAFPPQRVSVSAMEEGVVTAGGHYTLVCNISRSATLPNSTLLEVMWLDPNNDTITSDSMTSITMQPSTMETTLTSTLTFLQVNISHGGQYSCAVNMTIPDIVTDYQVIAMASVRVLASKSTNFLLKDRLINLSSHSSFRHYSAFWESFLLHCWKLSISLL